MRDVVIPSMESGQVTHVARQVPYELQPKFAHDGVSVRPITYVADFVITYADGHVEVIDIKGMPDAAAIIKRKLFWYRYPDVIYRWITYSKRDGGWLPYETVKKNRAARKKEKKGAC